MKRPELLIPAGNLERLRTALLYGADAVYVGIAGLSLRAEAAEMSLADLAVGIGEAHARRVKVYAALNTFARNTDLEKVKLILPELVALNIDGLIVSDPGIIRLIRKLAPQLPIHLSTQANTMNTEAVRFWADQGVSRIVLARELNLAEVAEIAAAVPEVELELFIHGAMCMAYSGRCYLSAHTNRRSSNQGDCTQPCRWEYRLEEASRPGQPLILEEDDRYSYLLSSKDLAMIEYLPQLVASGVVSLKIEGRMKSTYYVAVVTRTYRRAIDALQRDPVGYHCDPEWIAELKTVSNRDYTTGFYFAEERITEVNPDRKYQQTHDLVGTVLAYEPAKQRILVGVRNQLKAEDQLELVLPDDILQLPANRMMDEQGMPLREAHNGYRVYFLIGRDVPVGAVIRREIRQPY